MLNKTCLLIATLALWSGGCGNDTGIIIEVTRSESSMRLANVDTLEFVVGATVEQSFGRLLPTPGERAVALADGRDLASDPFRLLLEAGDFGDFEAATTDLRVVVIGSRNQERIGWGTTSDPVRFVDGKVLKYTVELTGDGRSFGDLDGDDCVSVVVGDQWFDFGSATDFDCDGDPNDQDCAVYDPSISHNQQENCFNGVDDDCDSQKDEEEPDADGDLYTNCGPTEACTDCKDGFDCQEGNAAINPNAAEVCDGVDNNCTEGCDELFSDQDGDGYLAECASYRNADGSCRPEVPSGPDCNDDNPRVHPEKEEYCDGVDNDCNFECDEKVTDDDDGDGFFSCGDGVHVHSGPVVAGASCLAPADCRPDDPLSYPGAAELCDGHDNDCDPETEFTGSIRCAIDAAGCVLGEATCSEGGGALSKGACESTGEPIPSLICNTSSDGCDTSPDPYLCLVNKSVTVEVECQLYFGPTDGGLEVEACPNRVVPVPTTGAGAQCTWGVYGVIGVPFAVAISNAVSCDATLGLADPLEGVLTTGHVFVYGGSSGQEKMYRLDISPVGVAKCPEQGLQCASPW